MTFGFTRDSGALWVGAVAALLAYLATMPVPTEWSYQQWIQFGIAMTGWLVGKLQTSPLPHSEEGDQKIPPSGK